MTKLAVALVIAWILAVSIAISRDHGPWVFWIENKPWLVMPDGTAY